jgi:hypothetical protein
MKWNMVLGALVISVGMCAQGYSFELLERMLGVNNDCGCAPACGCEADPGCGCEAAPACGCQTDPGCGCEAEPSCCCEPAGCPQPCCKKKHCGGLLDGLFKRHRCHKKSCCEPACGCEAEPSCGCAADPGCGCAAEPSCGCCCKKKHCGGLGLLKGLFRHKKRCCSAAPSCGCEAEPSCGCAVEPSCGCATGGAVTPADGGATDQAAPMPPAPMADPSASLQSRRRIVQVSSVVRRR